VTACSQTEEKTSLNDTLKIKTDTIKANTQPIGTKTLALPDDFKALVPIDLLDSKSSSGYDKYGIEFSGNCYACDLASLSITKDKILWTNVCDEKDTFEMQNFTFSVEGKKTIIKTSECTLTLSQIDKAPVYELVIEGKKLDLKNKRISKYFTTKYALPLFKEHDCGEFDG